MWLLEYTIWPNMQTVTLEGILVYLVILGIYSPVVRIRLLSLLRAWVGSLVWELRPRKLHVVQQKPSNNNENKTTNIF